MSDQITKMQTEIRLYERQFTDLRKRLTEKSMMMQTVVFWADASEFVQALTTVEDRDKFLEMAPSLASAEPVVMDESVRQLLRLIDSPEEEVRVRAVISLRFLQQGANDRMQRHVDATVNKLLPLLDDDSSSVVGETLFALESFGPGSRPALDRLNRMMMDDEQWGAPTAARVIAAIDPSADVGNRLIELIEARHPDWYSAAWILPQHVPAAQAREVLSELYDSLESDGDKNAVIQVLNQIER